MTRRLQETVDRAFGDLSPRERDYLCRSAQSNFSQADTAAVVLGLDLRRDEIAAWRECFERESERPSMWRFSFEPCARWNTARWRSLPLEARILRARAGSPAHAVHVDGIVRAGIKLARRDPRIAALRDAGLAEGSSEDLRLAPLAYPDKLAVDLALVVIVAHWIGACAIADRIADATATEHVEIHGYRDACRFCRAAWGVAPLERRTLPPRHPACRCFAQPAYRPR